MTARYVQTDPETGIPDLVRSLTDDSKRLIHDEIRLARIEAAQSMRDAARGTLWVGIAFGIGVIAMVAFTFFLAAGLGNLMGGRYWLGTVTAGVLELAVGFVLLKRGTAQFGDASFTLEETRAEAKETIDWIGEQKR